MKLEKNGVIKEITNTNEIADYISAGFKEYKEPRKEEVKPIDKVGSKFKS